MEIVKNAIAGTLESSDVLVKVSPSQDGTVTLHIQSEVIKQFGKQIRATVMQTLEALSVSAATVVVSDKGALDCV
ncbi:MAG TPA: citrate lyase acyl carrier protein, partial [Acidisphaera sp.]|nr:citrate lyase acyl carrier protein [Acidisphaera sp.]